LSLLTKNAREKADAARYAIKGFIVEASAEIPPGSLVLDAGAGNCRYREFFHRQRYIAADFCRVADKNYKRMGLVTDLTELALKDGTVDAIINVQVLEHVCEPQRLVSEFARALKSGGTLYLTCPQGWGVHEAPYDFYRFTNFALADIFAKSGLDVISIEPMGGYFNLLGKLISRLPYQFDRPKGLAGRALYRLWFPVMKELFFFWTPYILSRLDFLDKKREFTIGYLCKVRKP